MIPIFFGITQVTIAHLQKSDTPTQITVPPSQKSDTTTSATWECYDGTSNSQKSKECLSEKEWNSIAEEFCKNKCVTKKCGVNSFYINKLC